MTTEQWMARVNQLFKEWLGWNIEHDPAENYIPNPEECVAQSPEDFVVEWAEKYDVDILGGPFRNYYNW